tara:strand:- start:11 stop:457 length:447 start_codon:yes stop_codon:yes gene_type:complete
MLSIKVLIERDIDLCYELDLNTVSLWSKEQWINEFKNKEAKVLGILFSNLIIGICVFHVVLDEGQINYFVINHKYRGKGFGTYLMNYIIKRCEKLNINKLFLEVSNLNIIAKKFYSRFDFFTVGIRRNYYKDGSDALLKEKKLKTKII